MDDVRQRGALKACVFYVLLRLSRSLLQRRNPLSCLVL